MSTKSLFGNGLGGESGEGKAKKADGEARVKRPDRQQSVFRPQIFDQLIPSDHRARGIVKFVEELDLAPFYASIKSRGSEPGRPATDPAMLIALWLFATSEGVGSARQIERLCDRDDAYRWICGGVQVNQHGLSDFRIDHGAALDGLLTVDRLPRADPAHRQARPTVRMIHRYPFPAPPPNACSMRARWRAMAAELQ